jgi:hypothetical protein
MDTITFGELRKHLRKKQCRRLSTKVCDKIEISGNTYDMFSKIVDRNYDDDGYILGIKIGIFEIVFVYEEGHTDVKIFNLEDDESLIDSFFNLERIPIKRYIGVSPVKSARN